MPKKTNLPDAVTVLYREEYMDLDYIELPEKCHNTQMSITEAECKATENKTRNQAESKVWFAQRAGQITTSKLKAACTTDISKPSKSLIKHICYPEAYKFYSAATSWGCKHEKRARHVYANKMSDSHEKFLVSDSGLHVNPKWPHLGASPDDFWSVLAVVKVHVKLSVQCVQEIKQLKKRQDSKIVAYQGPN